MCTGVLYLLRQISPAEELADCNHCTHLSQKSILYCILKHYLFNQPAINYDRMYSGHIITLCFYMKYTCLHKSSQNHNNSLYWFVGKMANTHSIWLYLNALPHGNTWELLYKQNTIKLSYLRLLLFFCCVCQCAQSSQTLWPSSRVATPF